MLLTPYYHTFLTLDILAINFATIHETVRAFPLDRLVDP
jgi:hypothetical protein